jgi:hypothetical protein
VLVLSEYGVILVHFVLIFFVFSIEIRSTGRVATRQAQARNGKAARKS